MFRQDTPSLSRGGSLKTSCILLALSMGTLAGAQAPVTLNGNVTLYGMLDAGLCLQTHTNASGNTNLTLQESNEGFLSGNRIGLKGRLDLDEGWQAGVTLENGFLGNSGKLDQQSQLFGRQAFACLSHRTYGELAAGRIYTVANSLLYYVDPLGVGASATNSWQVFLTGQRFDNAITYSNTFSRLQVTAQYAAGGVAGKPRARSSQALGGKWTQAPVVAVALAQQTYDTQGRRARTFLAGLKWTLGRVDLFGNGVHSRRDAGFDASNAGADTSSITSLSSGLATSAAALNSPFSAARRDDFATFGASFHAGRKWLLTAAMMTDHTRADAFSGTRSTAYGVADRSLGRYADVYIATGYERTTGGWSGLFGNSVTNAAWTSGAPLNGNNSQATEMLGFRLHF